MNVTNAVFPGADQIASFFAGAEDGPFVMVNLLKFKDKAEYPDGSEPELSGRDAYMRYGAAVLDCLRAVGGKAIFSSSVTELLLGQVDELWDMVALAEYPSREAMRTMIASPAYQAIEKHRLAGLAGQLNIRTKAMAG